MNPHGTISRTRSIVALLFFLLSLSLIAGGKSDNAMSRYTSPKPTAAGILYANESAGALMLVTDAGERTISVMPGATQYVALASDGRTVGFKEIREDGKQSPVIVDLMNGERKELFAASDRVGQPSFSDAGDIAFTLGTDLVVIRGAQKNIYPLGVYANIAPLSPDGRHVVFNDDMDQLWLLDLSTMRRIRISPENGAFALPQWSPNGDRILFSRLDGEMFCYDAATTSVVRLGSGDAPVWKDDATILFARTVSDGKETTASDLMTIAWNGTNLQVITATNDAMETDPYVDQVTGAIYYADLQRGGLYALSGDSKKAIVSPQKVGKTKAMQQVIDRSNAVATPAATSFAMPYVHQVWDTPDWYNGSAACGATSAIMVIAYYHVVPQWNVWCSASGSSPGHYSPYGNYVCETYTYREFGYSFSASDPNGKASYGGYGFMWTGSYSPYSRIVDYYGNHGISATRYDSSASFFPTVIANVDSGYPFTLCNGLTTAGHIIVVNGYDVNNRTLIVNDPYGNKNTGTYPSLNGKGVKYDWVGYNNGYKNLNRIYWGVSVRYTKPAPADTLVDDAHLDNGFFMSTAAPSSFTRWSDKRTGGYGNGHFWWTRTKSADTCFAVWTPNLPMAGQYEVLAYIPYSDATKVRYTITASSGPVTVVASQKSVKAGWLSLGTYDFPAGSSGTVRLGDGSDTTKQGIVYDAVRWSYRGAPLSVASISSTPDHFSLQQNYPNPFNPATTIPYTLGERSTVVLTVHDMLGRSVATLVRGTQEAGSYAVPFIASALPSGVYYYRLQTNTITAVRRMQLLK